MKEPPCSPHPHLQGAPINRSLAHPLCPLSHLFLLICHHLACFFQEAGLRQLLDSELSPPSFPLPFPLVHSCRLWLYTSVYGELGYVWFL